MPEVNESIQDTEVVATTQKEKERIFLNSVIDYIELFVIAICVVLTLFSVAFRTCTVDGDSMNNTLKHEEVLIVSNLFYTPKRGDVIVFQSPSIGFEEPLVKRIIATEGQTVEINLTTGVLKVNGEIQAD